MIKQIVIKVLRENKWGLYTKIDPLATVPIQDGTQMYRISEVNDADLLQAIELCEPDLD